MKSNITLSLCMIVKNEEKTLERCLNSVKSFIDEIIIVDTGSTDDTKEIAKRFGAKVFDFRWVNNFAAARNFSFSKATSDYILWLDGDDFIDEENITNIKKLILNFDNTWDFISGKYILGRDANGSVNYSIRRNRIVRRTMNFRWVGHVHEYLEVYGVGFQGDFAIEHGKVKAYTKRNLNIFKEMEEKNIKFTSRDLLYYANELFDNGFNEEAIKIYREFLETKEGWIEDIKTAYAKMIECNKVLNRKKEIPKLAFESFEEDVPRADICCALGEYYLENELFKQAIFWYRVALDCRHEKDNPAMDIKAYYTFIPALQLCVCYFKIGNLNCSYFYNELADEFLKNSPTVEYNRKYFLEEFTRRNIEKPNIETPIKPSDYVNYV